MTVSFDPFDRATPAYAVTLPLFVLIFIMLILGVAVGGIAAWFTQGKRRRHRRRLEAARNLARRARARHAREGDASGGAARHARDRAPVPARAGECRGASARTGHRGAAIAAIEFRGTRRGVTGRRWSHRTRQGSNARLDLTFVIKICGLSTAEALDAALDAGADMVGFVFFPPSPRHLDFDGGARSRRARRAAAPRTWRLRSMPTMPTLAAIVEALRPDLLQLHGTETPERVAAVQARVRPAGHEGDRGRDARPTSRRRGLCRVADRLLFDAKPPRDATRPGGNGMPSTGRFCRRLTRACRSCFPAVSTPAMSPRPCT